MKLWIASLLLLFFAAGCGEKPVAIEEKMCRLVVEDVFLPETGLQIARTERTDDGLEIKAMVHYSILDPAGQRMNDITTCIFDKAAADLRFKKITQFNADIPEQHVEFLSKRITRKIAEDPAGNAKP